MTINTKYLALLAAVLLLPATAFAQQESTATFIIEKYWNQGGNTNAIEVTGHLSCTGAVTTQQDVIFTATTDAVLFVYDIINVPEGQQVDCKAWETVPDNYTAVYNVTSCPDGNCGDTDDGGLDYCFFPAVDYDEEYRCVVTNTPDPAEITVNKTWVIEGASQGFNEYHEIGVYCDDDEEVLSEGACYKQSGETWHCVDNAVDGEYVFTVVNPYYPASECYVWENNWDSVIEVDNGCSDGEYFDVSAGDVTECEIVNTVFFEAIPTLSQYGMAILALLMLGVGLVGFRRFV